MNSKVVALTGREERVFAVLLAAGRTAECTVRAAGGWVRDKLLGIASSDVDVALDKMDGEQFAEKVVEIVKTSGNLEMSSIGTIRRNPEKSKHLNTATFVLEGISIDANNLRSEEYANSSRIPTARLGTPLEDAQRRDFTINALFFNLNTHKIEDLTEKGISDLQENILRTPLDPHTTFNDDPLRIVRAIRFAAKFRMNMATDLRRAISDSTLVRSLTVRRDSAGAVVSKVSGERIGTEIEKMFMHTETANIAYRLMTSETPIGTALLESIPFTGERNGKMEFLFPEFAGDASFASLDARQTKVFFFALLTTPVRDAVIAQGKKDISAALYFLKEVLHINKHDADIVATVFAQLPTVARLTQTHELILTGKFLRALKEDWPLAIRIAATLHPEMLANYEKLEIWIRQTSGLVNCWEWRAPFDGKALGAEPFQIERGPKMAQAIERQLELMYEGETEPDNIRRRLLEDRDPQTSQ